MTEHVKIEPTFVSKLSVASCGMTPYAKKNIPEPGEPPFAAGRFWGTVTGAKQVAGSDGELGWALQGTFRAHCYKPIKANPEKGIVAELDGKHYISSVLYLPGGQTDPLAMAITAKDRPQAINFGMDVGVINAGNPQGYSWVGKNILPSEAKDPLEVMMAQLSPPPKRAIAIADGTASASSHQKDGGKKAA